MFRSCAICDHKWLRPSGLGRELVDMLPRLPKSNTRYLGLRNTIACGQRRLIFSALPDVAHDVIGQLTARVARAAWTQPQRIGMVSVLEWCHILQIIQSVIALVGVNVVRLESVWSWAYKRSHNDMVNHCWSSAPVANEDGYFIAEPIQSGSQAHTGRTLRAYASKGRHVVSVFVANYWLPFLAFDNWQIHWRQMTPCLTTPNHTNIRRSYAKFSSKDSSRISAGTDGSDIICGQFRSFIGFSMRLDIPHTRIIYQPEIA